MERQMIRKFRVAWKMRGCSYVLASIYISIFIRQLTKCDR